jgi:tetratricopeptide (TPR) repeat protein
MFNRIRELGMGTASPVLVAQSLVGLGNCGRGSGQMGVARDRLDDAIDLARRHGLPLVHANALTSMAMLDFDAGNMAAGAARLEQAVELLEEHGDLVESCRSHYLLSHTLQGLGRYDDAVRRARQAIRLAKEIGDEMLLVGGTIALANTRLELGWLQEAIGLYRTCLPLCETHHNVHRTAVCWLNIALANIDCGDIDAARVALEPVFELRRLIPDRLIGAALFDLALCDEGNGHLDSAHDHYLASLDFRERVGQHALAIDSLAGLARVAIGRQEVETARRTLQEIDDRLARQGSEGIEHPGRLWITQHRGGILMGDEARSQAAVRHAISTLRERAVKLADPADRRSYLHHVPSNRVMVEHGREYGLLDADDPLWDRTA